MLHSIIEELRAGTATPEKFISISLETVEMANLIPSDEWHRLGERSMANEHTRSALSQVNLLLIAALNAHNPKAAGRSRDSQATVVKNLSSSLSLLYSLIDSSLVHITDITTMVSSEIPLPSMAGLSRPGRLLSDVQRNLVCTLLRNSISSLEKDISNHEFRGQDIFNKDLCADCQARLQRKYPKKSLHIPARMQHQKELCFCMAYIVGAWHGLFKSMHSFCNYSSRVGEEYAHALKAKGTKVNYIESSTIRKILEKHLEQGEMKFLEKRMK